MTMKDPPPNGIDPNVWYGLRAAHAAQVAVTVYLAADPARGRPEREMYGFPVRFDLDYEGQVRVVLSVVEGTEQRVLVSRIARVVAHVGQQSSSGTHGDVSGEVAVPPAAVVLSGEPLLRDVITTTLELDGWRVEERPFGDATGAPEELAALRPALVVLGAVPRRADLTLAAAQSLRRCAELGETPILVASLNRWDVPSALRHAHNVRIVAAPFSLSDLRNALADLSGVVAQSG